MHKRERKQKKIKEQAKKMKKWMANIKENFPFHVRFRLVWTELNMKSGYVQFS